MNWFMILTILFTIVAVALVLIILVQRPSGGGLAGAFGGAGGGTDTVFGGRVGDALTWSTVVAFLVFLALAVSLNLVPVNPDATTATPANAAIESTDGETETPVDPTAAENPASTEATNPPASSSTNESADGE